MIQVINLFVDYLLIKLWDISLSSTFDNGEDKKPAEYS